MESSRLNAMAFPAYQARGKGQVSQQPKYPLLTVRELDLMACSGKIDVADVKSAMYGEKSTNWYDWHGKSLLGSSGGGSKMCSHDVEVGSHRRK
jgi:hypothetical protein